MTNPWIEDAKSFRAIEDLEDTSLYLTEALKEYLAHENTQRTVLVAPKGCGKTLLIKHKRRLLQDRYNHGGQGSVLLLPNNQMVSVGPAYAPPYNQESIDHLQDNLQYWSTLWQISLTLIVLRNSNVKIDNFRCQRIKECYADPLLSDPFFIFVQIIKIRPRDYQLAVNDFQALLIPAYAACHSPMAIFIDNVDEFFGHHIAKAKRSSLHGQIAREIWHNAQVGLLMAVRQISSLNPHIKVFATIRSEAYSAREADIPDLANVRAHTQSIRFRKDDLRRIFINNIDMEKPERLADPRETDPFCRFFGKDNVQLRHIYTGKKEHVFDYIYRHTMGRPRDFMTIGHEISSILPNKRTVAEIREAVNRASVEITKSYLSEVSPHLHWFEQDVLFNLIDRNCYDKTELSALQKSYEAALETIESGDTVSSRDGGEALSDLYAAGILGILRPHAVTGEMTQHFESVFDFNCSLQPKTRRLPQSNQYLIHNSLGSYVRHKYLPEKWNANTINFVCPDAIWEDSSNFFYVAQLDIVGSTQLNEEPGSRSSVVEIFEDACERALQHLNFREPVTGDSVAFASRNGYLVVKAAHRIARALRNSIIKADVRVGLDYGP